MEKNSSSNITKYCFLDVEGHIFATVNQIHEFQYRQKQLLFFRPELRRFFHSFQYLSVSTAWTFFLPTKTGDVTKIFSTSSKYRYLIAEGFQATVLFPKKIRRKLPNFYRVKCIFFAANYHVTWEPIKNIYELTDRD